MFIYPPLLKNIIFVFYVQANVYFYKKTRSFLIKGEV